MYAPFVIALAAAVLASATSKAVDADLVYDARFYFQGSKRSYHQIYLVRHDGKGQRQLTHKTCDCVAPVWLDKDHVAYVERRRTQGPPHDADARYELRVINQNVKTGRSRVLKVVSGERAQEYVGQSDGAITTPPWDGSRLIFKQGEPVSHRVNKGYAYNTTDEEGLIGQMKVDSPTGTTSLQWKNREPLISPNAGHMEILATCKGDKKTYTLEGDLVGNGFCDGQSSLILVTQTAWTKFDWSSYIYQVPLPLGEPRLLVKDVGDAQIAPGSDLWLGHQTTAPRAFLKKLGDGRQVYCNWLFAGNWRTGQRWTLAEGLVEVGSANLRPSRYLKRPDFGTVP